MSIKTTIAIGVFFNATGAYLFRHVPLMCGFFIVLGLGLLVAGWWLHHDLD